MDSKRYEAFVAAVDTQSMSGAAKRLGYTPSGIIRLLNALEEELGFALLSRTSTGVVCTMEGERMLPIFRKMMELDELARSTGERIRGLAEGTLTIGVPFSLASGWLPRVLERYQELHPDVQVVVRCGSDADLRGLLEAHEVDCCVFHGDHTRLDWVSLGKQEVVAWLPRGSKLAQHSSILLAEFAGRPFASMRDGESAQVEAIMRERGIEPDTRFSVPDYHTAYQLVDKGLCQAFGCAGIARDWPGSVEERPLSPRRFMEYGIATLPAPSVGPAVEEFMNVAALFHDTCRR